MDAAERIFLKKGIAATSVDEIVVAADVAKGTFYLHFPSKEHLLLALQQRFVVNLFDDFQAAMNERPEGDWKGRLRAWVRAGVDAYLDRAAVHALVFHEFRPDGPRTKHANPIVDELAEFLGRGTKAGVWSVETPHLTAVMLFQALHGALDDAIDTSTHENEKVNRKRLARALEAFFHRALALSQTSA